MDGLGFDDMDEFGRELDDPFAELEQDVIHMLLETFGSNPDEPTRPRGVGLLAALSASADRIPGIRAQIEAQLSDDVRITSASCSITPADTSSSGRYRIDLVLVVNGAELALAFNVDAAGGVRRASS